MGTVLHLPKPTKKLSFLLVFLLGSFCGFSQSKFFFGVNAGTSFINDKALSSSVAGAELNNRPGLFFPVMAGVYISDRSRVRFDLGSFKMKSTLHFKYPPLQNEDASVPNHTEVLIKAESLNLNYDYRVMSTGKFEVYASAGSRLLFSTKKNEASTYGDGREEASDILIYDYCRGIFGLGAGIVTKYNYSNNIGFTISPDYTHYFSGFNEGDRNKLKRRGLTIGLEFRL
ncbi:hypothetical protein BH24BAC1_BH24BAC1_11940 [soil metagenome]